MSELEFDIQTKQLNIEKASIRLIFTLRKEPSLVIITERGQYSYKQFSKLALIRRCIFELEDKLGSGRLSATDSEEDGFVDAEEGEKSKTVKENRKCEKMTSDGQFDLNLALKLIDKFDGTGAKTAVDDFAASVKYYSDVLGKGSEENAKLQRKELIDFIMRIKLKGEARDLFTRHPQTIEELCDALCERFKPEQSLPQLREELFNTKQEARSVDTYSKAIERVSSKIIQLQLAGKSPELIDTVKELNEEMVLNAFLAGLDGEIKNAAVASQAKTLKETIKVAQSAEAAFKMPKENVFAVRVNNTNNYRRGNGYRGNNMQQWGRSNNNYWPNQNTNSGGYSGFNNYQPRGNYQNNYYQPQMAMHSQNNRGNYKGNNFRGNNFRGNGNAPRQSGNRPVNVIETAEQNGNNNREFEQQVAVEGYGEEFFRGQY